MRRFCSGERLRDALTSKRSVTRVFTLLTFCPPGPLLRAAVKVRSSSGIENPGRIRIIAAPSWLDLLPQGEENLFRESQDVGLLLRRGVHKARSLRQVFEKPGFAGAELQLQSSLRGLFMLHRRSSRPESAGYFPSHETLLGSVR